VPFAIFAGEPAKPPLWHRELGQAEHGVGKGTGLDHPPDNFVWLRAKGRKTWAAVDDHLIDEVGREGPRAAKPLFESFEACLFLQAFLPYHCGASFLPAPEYTHCTAKMG
jgi:hypothetical protein